MSSIENLLQALVWVAAGIGILMNVERLTRAVIRSEITWPSWLEKSEAYKKFRRLAVTSIWRLLGWAFVVVGILQLYAFVTGGDWPFHYRGLPVLKWFP